MYTRIFILLLAAVAFLPSFTHAQKFTVNPDYKTYKTKKGSWHGKKVEMVSAFSVMIDKENIKCTANEVGNWTFEGPGASGKGLLKKSDGDGIWWDLSYGMEKVTVKISEDSEGTNDPRELKITSKDDTVYLFNQEPDMNSHWGLSLHAGPGWEVKFVAEGWNNEACKNDESGKTKWDDNPEWIFDGDWKQLDGDIRFAFIFASLLAQNVRYHEDLK